MKCVLEVCLIAISIGTFAPAIAAGQSPAMQQGISVQLVPTRHALPIPQADRQDAFIVAVTADSAIYLGINPITLPELAEKTRTTPFMRDQAIYIKADARTPYAAVLQVIEAASSGGMIPQVLLTSQPQPTRSGGLVSPAGLHVLVDSAFPSGGVATIVELLPGAQGRTLLKVNNDEVAWSAMANTLSSHFQNSDDRIVLLKANLNLPFAEVVHAIDACRAVKAKVFLASPGN